MVVPVTAFNPETSDTCDQLASMTTCLTHWLMHNTSTPSGRQGEFAWHQDQIIKNLLKTGHRLFDHYLNDTTTNLPSTFMLSHDRNGHAGIMILKSNQSTPIHDHACSAALSLLVQGSAQQESFSIVCRSHSTVIIRKTRSRNLETGAVEWHTPKTDTRLHRLCTSDSIAMFIDIQFPPMNLDQRKLYFINHEIGDEQYSCFEIAENILLDAYEKTSNCAASSSLVQ